MAENHQREHDEASMSSLGLPIINWKYALTAFNVIWKLAAAFIFVLRMYFNQQSLLETTKHLEARMTTFETTMNQQIRKQTEDTATVMARFDQLISDRTYYEQTTRKR